MTNSQKPCWVKILEDGIELWCRAPKEKTLLLEPRFYLEDKEGSRLASFRLFQYQNTEGPSGAIEIPAGESKKLFTWTGEIDVPSIVGPSAKGVTKEEGPKDPGAGESRVFAPKAQYQLQLYSFLDGELWNSLSFRLPSPKKGYPSLSFAKNDSAFIKGFMAQTREADPTRYWVRPGRWKESELDEMASFAEIPQIPSLHRELLLRVKRLRIMDHDLVTPPIIEEDLEIVRAYAGEQNIFPWFSLKPYDQGEFICFDLDNGGLVQTLYRRVEILPESPRDYLSALLAQAIKR